MYSSRPNLMIGFHGCDETVRNSLIASPNIVRKSQETYDWLGHGFYIWENNIDRALQWAEDRERSGKIKKASVIGVVYQLDYCLDFTDSKYIGILSSYYKLMKDDLLLSGKKIEEEIKKDIATKRFSELKHFDTVRGLFTEGGPAFDGAGIQLKNHIQICIRNLNCIKGFFIPRKEIKFP